jgi:hypothetical protein
VPVCTTRTRAKPLRTLELIETLLVLSVKPAWARTRAELLLGRKRLAGRDGPVGNGISGLQQALHWLAPVVTRDEHIVRHLYLVVIELP